MHAVQELCKSLSHSWGVLATGVKPNCGVGALCSEAGIKRRPDPVTITQQLLLLIILRQGIVEMTAHCQQLSSAAPSEPVQVLVNNLDFMVLLLKV